MELLGWRGVTHEMSSSKQTLFLSPSLFNFILWAFPPLLNLDEIAGKSHGFLGHFQVTKGHSVHCH